MPSAVAGFLIWAARRLQGWDSYERPVAADLKTSEQALARGADAHGSGGRGLSIREITCLFAQNQQSCLLSRNNVDDATPYKSIIVTPAYWRSAETRRVPHRCMSDLLRNCSPTEGESTASCQDDKHGQEMTRQPVRWWVFKAWLGCPKGKKTRLSRKNPESLEAPSAHRRPGYSSSGCTPAEPDSASPGEETIAEPARTRQGHR